jgi:hypothetical protein
MKFEKIYIIDGGGLDVRELELLREDDLFVYCRYPGEKGRGSSYHKFFARKNRTDAYNDAAAMLEERAKEHREMGGA